jgi:hypothetical protein
MEKTMTKRLPRIRKRPTYLMTQKKKRERYIAIKK